MVSRQFRLHHCRVYPGLTGLGDGESRCGKQGCDDLDGEHDECLRRVVESA